MVFLLLYEPCSTYLKGSKINSCSTFKRPYITPCSTFKRLKDNCTYARIDYISPYIDQKLCRPGTDTIRVSVRISKRVRQNLSPRKSLETLRDSDSILQHLAGLMPKSIPRILTLPRDEASVSRVRIVTNKFPSQSTSAEVTNLPTHKHKAQFHKETRSHRLRKNICLLRFSVHIVDTNPWVFTLSE